MLDTRTVIAASVVVLLAGIFVLVINWRINSSMRGPRWWALGFALRALGSTLIVFRPNLPDWFIVVSYTALITGFMALLYGLALFSDKRYDLKFMALLLAIDVVGACYFTLVEPLGFARSTIHVAATSILLVLGLSKLRLISRMDGVSSVIFLTICYVALLVLDVLSMVLPLLYQPGMLHALEPSAILSTILLLTLVTEALSIFGYVLLTSGRSQRELRTMAMTDVLTGLPNRRAFSDEMTRALSDIQRAGTRPGLLLGLAIIDVDNFKKINDDYGHDAGDRVLTHISERIRETLRGSDFVARIGGEEFALLIHAKGTDELLAVAERVRRCVEESPAAGESKPVHCSISVGIAHTQRDAADYDTLYTNADAALYQAKAAGRNQVVLAS